MAAEKRVSIALKIAGAHSESFGGSLLFDPDAVRTNQREPFKVFTPFWKACLALPSPLGPIPAPKEFPRPDSWPSSVSLRELELLPRLDWAKGIRDAWTPGEAGAASALDGFLAEGVASYTAGRNRPDIRGTSRLSPHLHFGEISPRRVWHESPRRTPADDKRSGTQDADDFLRQLGWREFAYHLLYHSPPTPDSPLRPEFADFPWREDSGATYPRPIVDHSFAPDRALESLAQIRKKQ